MKSSEYKTTTQEECVWRKKMSESGNPEYISECNVLAERKTKPRIE